MTFEKRLLETRDYREFLTTAFEQAKNRNPRISYASVARRSGFRARSYVRELFTGKKKPTPLAINKIATALGLKKSLQEYLQVLLACDFESFNPKNHSELSLQKKLKAIKLKILRETKPEAKFKANEVLPTLLYWPIVYAALGEENVGSTTEEVSQRTGLSPQMTPLILTEMVNAGVARLDPATKRYIAVDPHIIFSHMEGSNMIAAHFLQAIRVAESRISTKSNRDDHLFQTTNISLDRSQLPELKNQLRDLIVRFSDQNEKATGDTIMTIVCAMFPQAERG